MKEILDKIKNLVGKKEPSLADMYKLMNDELKKAEDDMGGNFFPEEKVLTPEQVHYMTLKLSKSANFDDVKENYKKLKKKYNPENFEKDSEKYKKAEELTARVEFSYAYFKNKFGIE